MYTMYERTPCEPCTSIAFHDPSSVVTVGHNYFRAVHDTTARLYATYGDMACTAAQRGIYHLHLPRAPCTSSPHVFQVSIVTSSSLT